MTEKLSEFKPDVIDSHAYKLKFQQFQQYCALKRKQFLHTYIYSKVGTLNKTLDKMTFLLSIEWLQQNYSSDLLNGIDAKVWGIDESLSTPEQREAAAAEWAKSKEQNEQKFEPIQKIFNLKGSSELVELIDYYNSLNDLRDKVKKAADLFMEEYPKLLLAKYALCLRTANDIYYDGIRTNTLPSELKPAYDNNRLMCKQFIDKKMSVELDGRKNEDLKKLLEKLESDSMIEIADEKKNDIFSSLEKGDIFAPIVGTLAFTNMFIGSGTDSTTNDNVILDFCDLLGSGYFHDKIQKLSKASCLGKLIENKYSEYSCYIASAIAALETVKSIIVDYRNCGTKYSKQKIPTPEELKDKQFYKDYDKILTNSDSMHIESSTVQLSTTSESLKEKLEEAKKGGKKNTTINKRRNKTSNIRNKTSKIRN